MVKGIGYALEAMMATIILVLFAVGAVEVTSPDQDWPEYQREIAAQDLTYSMQTSGKLENFASRGEMGSFQNAVTTISDRDLEASGAVSDLPLYELSIGYFVRPDKRIEQDISEVGPGDACSGDLSELERSVDDPSDPIYKTDSPLPRDYNVTLYFANTNPNDNPATVDDYDTLWVDNGTQCQFASEDGPFYIDEMFFWGDRDQGSKPNDYYTFKGIDVSSGEASLYNATQGEAIKSVMEEGINGVETSVEFDAVNFDDIEDEEYDALIFSEREALSKINENDNLRILEDHLISNAVLFLMNPEESDLDSGILNDANLDWMDTGYEGGYSGGLTNTTFSRQPDSAKVETFYRGQGANPSDLELRPPGKVVSNSSKKLETGRTLYSPTEDYDYTTWNRSAYGFTQIDPASIDGEPSSGCYSGGSMSSSLTEGQVDFREKPGVDVLNAEIGSCSGDRAVKLDLDSDGDYDGDLYLNGEAFTVEGVQYFVDIEGACPDYGDGVCVDFIAAGNAAAELLPHTTNYDSFNGNGRLGLIGYEPDYSREQNQMIVSAIHWMTGSTNSFEGLEDPGNIDTVARGSVDEEIYMPYEINFRWSQ